MTADYFSFFLLLALGLGAGIILIWLMRKSFRKEKHIELLPTNLKLNQSTAVPKKKTAGFPGLKLRVI